MLDLENLIPLLMSRSDDKNLIKALNKYHETGEKIHSLKELEKMIGATSYQRMMKS